MSKQNDKAYTTEDIGKEVTLNIDGVALNDVVVEVPDELRVLANPLQLWLTRIVERLRRLGFYTRQGHVTAGGLQEAQKRISVSISKGLGNVLVAPSFEKEINDAVERFTPGTREWVFEQFDDWFAHDNTSRVLVLSGEAGIGKTGIVSQLVCSNRDTIVAHHFCRHDSNYKNDTLI